MGRKVIVVFAGCAAFAAAPASALADNGFPAERQAAADQYPTQPPPAGTPGSGTAGEHLTGGSSGAPRPAHRPGSGHRRTGATTRDDSASGVRHAAAGAGPVAVPTRAVRSAKGSLPFTGSDLSGLVVLALALLAGGFLLAAGERATRRRRAPA